MFTFLFREKKVLVFLLLLFLFLCINFLEIYRIHDFGVFSFENKQKWKNLKN